MQGVRRVGADQAVGAPVVVEEHQRLVRDEQRPPQHRQQRRQRCEEEGEGEPAPRHADPGLHPAQQPVVDRVAVDADDAEAFALLLGRRLGSSTATIRTRCPASVSVRASFSTRASVVQRL